jgi:hypothetical protein
MIDIEHHQHERTHPALCVIDERGECAVEISMILKTRQGVNHSIVNPSMSASTFPWPFSENELRVETNPKRREEIGPGLFFRHGKHSYYAELKKN